MKRRSLYHWYHHPIFLLFLILFFFFLVTSTYRSFSKRQKASQEHDRIEKEYQELKEKKDVEAAREWLLDAPPDLVSSGDQKLMQALASENVTKGVDFIDTLLARKENERASNAVISLGANYAKQHPEEALNWALALPEFVKKSAKQQVISQALEKLSHEDMQRVKDLAAANKDPEIQWLYDIAVNRQKTK